MSAAKTVMVVDDDRQVLRYLTDTLRDEGYNTVACDRFQDAKGMLASVRPDLLVTDIRLGAFNGLQLGLYARNKYPDIPVIVLTGYEDPTLREEASKSGATFLVKPVRRDALLKTIAERLGVSEV
jgi:DNA-binding NtrC family response regulator